jgi:hypothetical protein
MHPHDLDVKTVAERLGVAASTLNSWLKDDEVRPISERVFDFHRWRGRVRRWSEEGFLSLEMAIHHESESGVLSGGRTREKVRHESPLDPDAEAALREVLGSNRKRTY